VNSDIVFKRRFIDCAHFILGIRAGTLFFRNSAISLTSSNPVHKFTLQKDLMLSNPDNNTLPMLLVIIRNIIIFVIKELEGKQAKLEAENIAARTAMENLAAWLQPLLTFMQFVSSWR
jgi:hypothetical protein